MRHTVCCFLLYVPLALGALAQVPPPHALIASEGGPLSTFLQRCAVQAGYEVRSAGLDTLLSAESLAGVDLLLLPNAARLPLDAVAPLQAYLERGGDLAALNAPLWQEALVQRSGAWCSLDTYRTAKDPGLLDQRLFDFADPASLTSWARSTNSGEFQAHFQTVDSSEAPGGKALRVQIDGINGWDTYNSPVLQQPFKEGQTLTVFWARGDTTTTELMLEWTEADGSRWIAVVPLVDRMQAYVLAPEDFHYWESVPGRKTTAFNPAQAVQLHFGLAYSHTHVSGGAHQYWMANIGTAARREIHEPLLSHFTPPPLETLCPSYKFFPTQDAAVLSRLTDGASPGLLPFPALQDRTLLSPQPRPGAGGFDKDRKWRWQALVEAHSEGGAWRGNPVTLLVHTDGPFKQGVWLSSTVQDADWYASTEVEELFAASLKRMREGLFLLDGGANFYTYFPDQPAELGLSVVNTTNRPPAACEARLLLSNAAGETVFQQAWAPAPEPGQVQRFAVQAPALDPARAPYAVRVELQREGNVLDATDHVIDLWAPKQQPEYVTTREGHLWLQGKPWRAHGVNYMPSSGIGTEDWEYFEHWVGKKAYDPVIIQRDLEHIADLGLNAVSVFIHHASIDSQNLLDLLRRCGKLGLKVNLSLRPGTPLEFEWDKIGALMERYRIAEQDVVFALDLAWEPMFPNQAGRVRWDEDWRAWVKARYGSVQHAEQDWGVSAPRDANGLLSNPTDQMMTEQGAWRILVAAYRRFLDTLLYENYSRARQLVRTLDTHHLVSFRMTEAGDPTFRGTEVVPYDYPYLAAAVDLLEPEAYGRIGDWERVKPALFQAAYATWAAPQLPVVWAEAGVHVWDTRAMRPDPGLLDFQGQYYRDFYRMLTESGADGIFWWWYPGGYRTNERSDYGIIQCDGTDRPSSAAIREAGAAFVAGPPRTAPDRWIAVDRDADPAGVPGIYAAHQEEFWEALAAGLHPGLHTAATGTTSATVPLEAVGGGPWDGSNPAKYLDAFFDKVEVREDSGAWRALEDGEGLQAAGSTPLLRFTLTNLGEATWLAEDEVSGRGPMVLAAGEKRWALPKDCGRFSTVVLELALEKTASSQTVEFRMHGVYPFGAVFHLALK